MNKKQKANVAATNLQTQGGKTTRRHEGARGGLRRLNTSGQRDQVRKVEAPGMIAD